MEGFPMANLRRGTGLKLVHGQGPTLLVLAGSGPVVLFTHLLEGGVS